MPSDVKNDATPSVAVPTRLMTRLTVPHPVARAVARPAMRTLKVPRRAARAPLMAARPESCRLSKLLAPMHGLIVVSTCVSSLPAEPALANNRRIRLATLPAVTPPAKAVELNVRPLAPRLATILTRDSIVKGLLVLGVANRLWTLVTNECGKELLANVVEMAGPLLLLVAVPDKALMAPPRAPQVLINVRMEARKLAAPPVMAIVAVAVGALASMVVRPSARLSTVLAIAPSPSAMARLLTTIAVLEVTLPIVFEVFGAGSVSTGRALLTLRLVTLSIARLELVLAPPESTIRCEVLASLAMTPVETLPVFRVAPTVLWADRRAVPVGTVIPQLALPRSTPRALSGTVSVALFVKVVSVIPELAVRPPMIMSQALVIVAPLEAVVRTEAPFEEVAKFVNVGAAASFRPPTVARNVANVSPRVLILETPRAPAPARALTRARPVDPLVFISVSMTVLTLRFEFKFEFGRTGSVTRTLSLARCWLPDYH